MLQQVLLDGWTFTRMLTPVLMKLTVCRYCDYKDKSDVTLYVHATI